MACPSPTRCACTTWSRALIIPLEQSLAIQAWIADGVDQAAEKLAEFHAFDTEITVLETHCSALGDFSSEGFEGGEALIAGVMRSFRGRISGTALLSMEPEDALAWTQANSTDAAPLDSYVDLAGRVLGNVAVVAAEALDGDLELGAARLEEAPIAVCLLRTHAPSDTVLVSARIEIRAGRQLLPAMLHLVLEPKVVLALLGALAVSVH